MLQLLHLLRTTINEDFGPFSLALPLRNLEVQDPPVLLGEILPKAPLFLELPFVLLFPASHISFLGIR